MRDSNDSNLARAINIFDGDGKQEDLDSPVSARWNRIGRNVFERSISIWWVNQGNTFDAARKGGQIFAPLEDKLGREPVHWRSVAEVESGDILVHCAGGQIRAIGRAVSGPIEDSRPVETTDPSVPEWKQMGRRVDVDYFDLKPPIAVGAIADRIRSLNITQGPFSADGGLKQGYLFRFSSQGLRVLREASSSSWPNWAATYLEFEPPSEESPVPARNTVHRRGFEALINELDHAGLCFSSEIVSNYLLALQTKRFVILTGISGTGKTQLALLTANHFRQNVLLPHAIDLPEGALEVTVMPSYVRYGNMVLPTTFTANLIHPPTGRHEHSRQIRVVYPDGAQEVTISKDPDRNVTSLFFSGAFRKWFLQRMNVGDKFAIELTKNDDGSSESLRVHLPTVVAVAEPLKNYEVSAVRPDWSDNRGLLGYFNPLIGTYLVTPLLRLLLGAKDEAERAVQEERRPAPFFVILDEMNLARVEHYFSDFLSALESGEPIHLHDHQGIEEGETEDAISVPRQLHIPENVYFTGTVNVDETTYMFSPKVLDRAFTIELNRVDLQSFGIENQISASGFALTRFDGSLGPAPKPTVADWSRFGELLDGRLKQVVLDLHKLLSDEDRHFGYRVANEIARFVVLASEQTDSTEQDLWTALDLAVLEKVLPKFHGTQQELESVLSLLMDFVEVLPLPRTARKIESMQRRLKRQGFTSFIE
jgi:hypothetical protein